jgi:hypothetical protein
MVLVGCGHFAPDPARKYWEAHSILPGKASARLVGPYKFKQELTANRILLEENGRPFEVVLRGCQPTDDGATNREAIRSIWTMWDREIYILQDSIKAHSDGSIRGILYTPTTRYYRGKDPTTGEMLFYNANYMMRQLGLLLDGEVWLDRTDTEYDQYPVFLEAERLARKYKRGYWATHDTTGK